MAESAVRTVVNATELRSSLLSVGRSSGPLTHSLTHRVGLATVRHKLTADSIRPIESLSIGADDRQTDSTAALLTNGSKARRQQTHS